MKTTYSVSLRQFVEKQLKRNIYSIANIALKTIYGLLFLSTTLSSSSHFHKWSFRDITLGFPHEASRKEFVCQSRRHKRHIRSLGREDPLEWEMATHSNIVAWTEEPDRLQSIGLHSICQQIWKTQQWPQDLKRSVFIPIPKKGKAKECSNYRTITLISYAREVMLRILQARLQENAGFFCCVN